MHTREGEETLLHRASLHGREEGKKERRRRRSKDSKAKVHVPNIDSKADFFFDWEEIKEAILPCSS